MPSDIDATDFVEAELTTSAAPVGSTHAHMSSSESSSGYRGPSREELDSDISRKQAELTHLRREQEKIHANLDCDREDGGACHALGMAAAAGAVQGDFCLPNLVNFTVLIR